MTEGLQYQNKSTSDLVDVMNQQMRGKTAWLAKDRLPAPAEATEEVVADSTVVAEEVATEEVATEEAAQ